MRATFFIVLILLLHSCSNHYTVGQYLSEKDLSTIRDKKYSKDQVAELFAAPSIISELDPNVWYYVSRNMATSPLSKPQLSKQQIVKLVFDKNQQLHKIEVVDGTNKEKFIFDSSSSPSYGTNKSLFQHWIGNFGKFGHKKERKNR